MAKRKRRAFTEEFKAETVRLMRESGPADLLARQFTAAAPNRAWVTDITYLWTGEDWLYLAVILALCSRFVVGWAVREHLGRQLGVGPPTAGGLGS